MFVSLIDKTPIVSADRLDSSQTAQLCRFISSPEHEVLMVSYCDQSVSVVRRASSVVNNLF